MTSLKQFPVMRLGCPAALRVLLALENETGGRGAGMPVVRTEASHTRHELCLFSASWHREAQGLHQARVLGTGATSWRNGAPQKI